MQTDRKIKASKPSILLKVRKQKLVEDKKRKTCKWIDLKIPADEMSQ